MLRARIVGTVTSTVKHPSFTGWRLLVAQPLNRDGRRDGHPLVVLDRLGADVGSDVMITSDGASVREMVGTNNTPARWAVIGILDQ
ncbi:MAG: ethanolamine utilization protein EutN [Planctomycetota bacterium]|nr:MAG: ethanolamine utilization protein EutN [Planctomycetota bacterium]